MILKDIADMPNFNSNVSNGTKSVSEGKVFFGKLDWMYEQSVYCVCCINHGACLCVSILNDSKGRLYRCEVCNEGVYAIVS